MPGRFPACKSPDRRESSAHLGGLSSGSDRERPVCSVAVTHAHKTPEEHVISATLPCVEDDAREVAGEELRRIRDQLSNSVTSTVAVLQFIIIIFAGTIVAAAKYPVAIVVLPLFWSVWLLHSLMTDRDTIKLAAYARTLEKKINTSLRVELLVWENRLAARTNRRPLIFQASYVYWALLNLASWALAIGVLVHQGMWPWAIVLGLLGATLWLIVLVTIKTRDDYAQRQEEILSALEPSESG